MVRVVLIFIHVTGAIGVFGALAIEIAMVTAAGVGVLAARPGRARPSPASMVSA